MSRPHADDIYKKQLEEAERLFDEDRMGECVSKVHKNLDEPNIPPQYVIPNYPLLACAVESWDEGRGWILEAEMVYQDALWEARQKCDGRTLQLLAPLREGIDKVDSWRLDAISGMTMEERIKSGWDEDMDGCSEEDESEAEYEEDLANLNYEETEAIAEAESEMDVAADQLGSDDDKAAPEVENKTNVATKHIRIPIRTKIQSPSHPVTEHAMNTTTTDVSTPPLLTTSEPEDEHTITTSEEKHLH